MNVTSESLLNRYKEFKQKSDNLKTSNPAMSNTYKKMSDRYYNMYTTQLNNERMNSANAQSDEDILDELESLDQLERTLTNNPVPPPPPRPPSIIQPQALNSAQPPSPVTTPTAPIQPVNRPLRTPPPRPRPPSIVQPQSLNSAQVTTSPVQVTTPTAPIPNTGRPLRTPPPPPPRNNAVTTNLPVSQSQNISTSLPPPRPARTNVSPLSVSPSPTPARTNVSPASFRSTLKKRQSTIAPIRANANTCKSVLTFGKRTNLKYFIPSQFPNITRAKYYTQQGGKRTRRRN